jgi:hypothetical protein
MSIIRAPRPQSNFYLLDKRISEDKRLSWAARGMLVFLLGKPDHWIVSTQHLINETAESLRPLSRDGVRAVLQELIQAGYLRRVLARADGGKLGGYDYEVSETCITPATEKPAPDGPAPEKPAPANPPLVRTDSKQELNGKQGLRRATRLPADWALPSDWRQWAEGERPDLDIDRTADTFRDYWISIGGKEGARLDWAATWRNWVRKERATGRRLVQQQTTANAAARDAEALRLIGGEPARPLFDYEDVIDG